METKLTSFNQFLGKISVLIIFISAILLLIGNYAGKTYSVIGSWGFLVGMMILILLSVLFGVDSYLQFREEQKDKTAF